MRGLRVGVVGVGRLGSAHARIVSEIEGCELVGVSDIDAGRARAVAGRLGTGVLPTDELAERCEAVIVAVTTSSHHSVARLALDAGCHVLVEKPLTPTLAEADDLVTVAHERGAFLAVGHVERFNPAVRACRALLEDPRYISSQRLARYQPRGTDVPVMLDLMIHDIDLVLGLVDSPVATVDAVGVPVLTDSIDIASARIRFENGAVADISASRVSEEPTRALRLFQMSGYISLDLAAGCGEFLMRKAGVGPGELWATRDPADLSLADFVERIPVQGDDAEPLRLEVEAFLDAIRGQGQDSVSAAEGRAALEIALRIQGEIERSTHVFAQDPRGA